MLESYLAKSVPMERSGGICLVEWRWNQWSKIWCSNVTTQNLFHCSERGASALSNGGGISGVKSAAVTLSSIICSNGEIGWILPCTMDVESVA